MDYRTEIESVRRKLDDLSHPPKVLDHVTFEEIQAVCDKHGAFQQRCKKANLLTRVLETKSECPACLSEKLAKLEADEAASEKRWKQSQIDRMIGDLQLPERFAGATLDNYQPVNDDAARCLKLCKAYAAKWPERLKQGGGLVMCGKPGTGKNHLALAIAKHVINEHQNSALFTTALRIARLFKSTWSKNSERTEAEVIRIYTDPELLIIDEVGVQFGSEAEKLILFEIINTRYERMMPTILISNLPKDELATFIGERVIDRMNDGGGCTLAFTWESYRSRGVA
ncbi:ATP-binding protein [Pantoea sp. 1B4]|uniref:ATP-binding protein n=1 Tax=Pantoea sp. 1B4 TaxID=2804760 RepID=UPI001AA7B2B8|nr:ATP-binding protein [Pantoea sp. 1B4]MBN1088099.1 ATP-binding protein [Pantoea sp. 1B4]